MIRRHARRLTWLVCLGIPACSQGIGDLDVVSPLPPDAPVLGLDAEEAERFAQGDTLFEEVFRAPQGLGPVYIRHACSSCHASDLRGPGAVVKMVLVEPDGVTPSPDQSALPWGHTARPQYAGGATRGITVPESEDALLVSVRAPPAVLGRGYMEAIPDAAIEALEREQAMRGDAISGRINRVAWGSEASPGQPYHPYGPGSLGLVGRFGLKARIATLDEFTADAYQGDMSITSPLRPQELPNPDGLTDDLLEGPDVDLETVHLVADYVRMLAIPPRADPDPEGVRLFAELECAVCHVPSLRTRADYPIAALADVDAPLFTDLLLHDMGANASDGLQDGDATPSEWRTAPLIGLRYMRSYLHDGRATTIEAAIAAHAGPGSEANASVAAFEALDPEARRILVRYVEGL